jgi:hypothetical protein
VNGTSYEWVYPVLSVLVAFVVGHLTGWARYKAALAKAADIVERAGGLVRWLSDAISDDAISNAEWDKGFEKLKALLGVIKA